MQLIDFNYNLPEELIARHPLRQRSASRLLCLNKSTGAMVHSHFSKLTANLSAKDLLVFNNTRVIPARLYGQKSTGGNIEMLVERILDQHRILAQIRASKSPKPGSFLNFKNNIRFEVLGRHHALFELRCADSRPVLNVIESIGEVPLPPYMQRSPDENDQERYQTIYAQIKGSVAAPTAGLHFDEEIFNSITLQGIEVGYLTLHVGAGTFVPVKTQNIAEHRMHAEYIEVSPELCEQIKKTKTRGGRVIAVGTTTARSLETASLSGEINPFSGDTHIFIYPPFHFKCIDGLITNFHLPCSSLLMLVAAFAGYETTMQAYAQAIAEKYRFFSYGDAMLII